MLAAVVVAPEVWAPQLLALQGVQRVLWWLSVDNAYQPGGDFFYDRLGTPGRYAVLRKAFERPLSRLLQSPQAGSLIHAVQSDYARRHVESRYGRATMLTDYLTDGLDAIPDVAALSTDRTPKVLYYPTKGLRPMKRVMQSCGTEMEFVALAGLSRPELVAQLREAMIYVDLGSHPGRDRLPREAAASGCVVVVGRRGAGGNAIDLPMPERYKVQTPSRTVSAEPVSRLLGQILGSFEEHQAGMAGFREVIRGQRSRFQAEVGTLVAALEGRLEGDGALHV